MNKEDIKLMIGTPVGDGKVELGYYKSMLETVIAFEQSGIQLEHSYVDSCSLVDCARNIIVKDFLEHPDNLTHLLFIDSDITWELDDIRELINYVNEKRGIVSGLSPLKSMDYSLIMEMASKVDNPEDLQYYMANQKSQKFNPQDRNYDPTKPVGTSQIGMEFVMIDRRVFETMRKEYPEGEYEDSETGEDMFVYFNMGMIKDTNGKTGFSGEDMRFCGYGGQMGGKIGALPGVNVGHIGKFTYRRKHDEL